MFVSFSGNDCSSISCITDCPLESVTHRDELTPERVHLTRSAFNIFSEQKEFYQSQSNVQLRLCCELKCSDYCVNQLGEIVPDGSEWKNMEDPCLTHFCVEGVVSNHTSMCFGLACGPEHYVKEPDECCPSCDARWASFCPEVDCNDLACQHGFVVDPVRRCDLCQCARRRLETTSTSQPEMPSAATPTRDNSTRTVPFYFYLDPTDGATKNLILGLTITCCVLLVLCLSGIGWYFHKKVYKKVPLLSSWRSTSA